MKRKFMKKFPKASETKEKYSISHSELYKILKQRDTITAYQIGGNLKK